jgi:thiol-disulfide isomerase/thioredoxin
VPAKSADQRLHDLVAAQKGRPVVINFWATWCEPCREELPLLQRLADRWHDQGLAVLTVAVADNLKRVEDVLWEASVNLPVIDDREQVISRSWGARALPTTLILDRKHRIRYRGQGAIDWSSAAVDQRLRPLFN